MSDFRHGVEEPERMTANAVLDGVKRMLMRIEQSECDDNKKNSRSSLGLDGRMHSCLCPTIQGDDISGDCIRWLKRDRDKANRKRAAMAAEHAAMAHALYDANAALQLVRTPTDGVWHWEDGGENDPKSLSCPVVMSAETLRGMLGERDEALAAAKVANSHLEKWYAVDFSLVDERADEWADAHHGDVYDEHDRHSLASLLRDVAAKARSDERAAIVAWLRTSGPMLNVDGATVHQDIAARIEHHFRFGEK